MTPSKEISLPPNESSGAMDKVACAVGRDVGVMVADTVGMEGVAVVDDGSTPGNAASVEPHATRKIDRNGIKRRFIILIYSLL